MRMGIWGWTGVKAEWVTINQRSIVHPNAHKQSIPECQRTLDQGSDLAAEGNWIKKHVKIIIKKKEFKRFKVV